MKKFLSITLSAAMLFSVIVFEESDTVSAQSATEVYTELYRMDFDDVETVTATADETAFDNVYGEEAELLSPRDNFNYTIAPKSEGGTDKYLQMDSDFADEMSGYSALHIWLPDGGFMANNGTYKISYDFKWNSATYKPFLRLKTNHSDKAALEADTVIAGNGGVYNWGPMLSGAAPINDDGGRDQSAANVYGTYSTYSGANPENIGWFSESYNTETMINLPAGEWHRAEVKIDTVNSKAYYYFNDTYIGCQEGATFLADKVCNATNIQLQVEQGWNVANGYQLDNITVSHSDSTVTPPSLPVEKANGYTELYRMDFDNMATADFTNDPDAFDAVYGSNAKLLTTNWDAFSYSIEAKSGNSADKYIYLKADTSSGGVPSAIEINLPEGAFEANTGTYKISFETKPTGIGEQKNSFLRVKTNHSTEAERAQDSGIAGNGGIYKWGPTLAAIGSIGSGGTADLLVPKLHATYSTFDIGTNGPESSWDFATVDGANKVVIEKEVWHTVDIKVDTNNKKAHFYYDGKYIGTQEGNTFGEKYICGEYTAKSIQLQIAHNWQANNGYQFDNITISHSEDAVTNPVVADLTGGISFKGELEYTTENVISTMPKTFEAKIKFPNEYDKKNSASPIISNYTYGLQQNNFDLSVTDYGGIKLSWENFDSDTTAGGSYLFDDVDVAWADAGYDWTHLAVVVDDASNQAHLYLNGELRQTVSIDGAVYPDYVAYDKPLVLGDGWKIDGDWLDCSISEVLLYDDARTADEIKADYESDAVDTDGLIAGWQPEKDADGKRPQRIADISGNGIDFVKDLAFLDEAPLDDYAYSFAVIGDTQSLNEKHPENFIKEFDWIVDSVDDYNIKYAFGLGDITEWDDDGEYRLAKACYDNLLASIPVSIGRGNHDSEAQFNKHFTFEEYGDTVDGTYDGTMLTTYKKFNAGGDRFMIVNLDCAPREDELAWANEIIAANPDRNVIITTHIYLQDDGTYLTREEDYTLQKWFGQGGDETWEKLVSQHENIVLVLSGHDDYDDIVVKESYGKNGHKVVEMLIDPQTLDNITDSGYGLVTLLCFPEDGNTMQVRYYSTAAGKFWRPQNQFSVELDLLDSTSPAIDLSNISIQVNLTGVEAVTGQLMAALYDENGILCNIRSYDAAETVNVIFENVTANSSVKCMWWDGTDTIMPIAPSRIVNAVK